jgi:hypothetical protein
LKTWEIGKSGLFIKIFISTKNNQSFSNGTTGDSLQHGILKIILKLN